MPSVGSKATRYPKISDPTERFEEQVKKVVSKRAVLVFVEGWRIPLSRWLATAKEKLHSKFMPVTPSRRANGPWIGCRAAINVLANP